MIVPGFSPKIDVVRGFSLVPGAHDPEGSHYGREIATALTYLATTYKKGAPLNDTRKGALHRHREKIKSQGDILYGAFPWQVKIPTMRTCSASLWPGSKLCLSGII